MIPNMLKNKKIIWFIILTVVVLIIGVGGVNVILNSRVAQDLEKIEYKTDVQPLINRFGKTIDIESCFWKSDTIGKTNFGPSSYWMKGFIKISQENLMELKTKHPMMKAEVHFEKGISPYITGFSNFDWKYNKELSREIAGAGFVGDFYLDINNGIFYFDLESN